VSGLGRGVTAAALTSHFGGYGVLAAPVRVRAPAISSRHVRVACVEFQKHEHAMAAVAPAARAQLCVSFGESARVALATSQAAPSQLSQPSQPSQPAAQPAPQAGTQPAVSQVVPPEAPVGGGGGGGALHEELCAARAAAWGSLDAPSEAQWEARVSGRLSGGLVLRHAADGSRVLWRVDALALEYFAHGGLPPSERLASPSAAAQAAWQPLLAHATHLAEPADRRTKRKRGGHADDADAPMRAADAASGGAASGGTALHAGFSALLLLPSECTLSPLRADVAQHALTMLTVAQQMLWFARAHKLQAALGVAFTDLNLLRRVRRTAAERPYAANGDAGCRPRRACAIGIPSRR
jgi:hypothetical protein